MMEVILVDFAILWSSMHHPQEDLLGGSNMEPRTTTTEQQQPAPQPVTRKQAEPPRTFYERLTKREDVRRLLAKLAKR
jgi:hypothetical protein